MIGGGSSKSSKNSESMKTQNHPGLTIDLRMASLVKVEIRCRQPVSFQEIIDDIVT